MSYTTTQAIREASGLQSAVKRETPVGTVNGTNRVFSVAKTPIVDTDYDGEVTPEDVAVTVNGERVDVDEIDPLKGDITLKVAPLAGTKVLVFYSMSALSINYVDGKQDEAESWVNMKISPFMRVPLSPVPSVISTATTFYAAGMILYKDYGNRINTEFSAKDGAAKIKEARTLIDEFLASQKTQRQTESGASQTIVATSDPDVFPRRLEYGRTVDTEVDDDYFWNRQ